jgi:energy-converting hydrogenase Eha subunit A
MVKKEDLMPTSLILTLLILSVVLIVSIFLPFITVVSTRSLGMHISSISGLAIMSGYQITGIRGYDVVRLIPIGAVTGMLSAALAFLRSVKSKPLVVGVIVLCGGLLALAGGIATCLQLAPLIGTTQNPIFQTVATTFSIGLVGAVVSSTVESIIAIRIILSGQS